ncbi:MAG: phosphatase PAP2 family protein [Dechloromonas sp.]|nr:phosphatase PAP2 family protein [Dechloromonas sp.]
MTSRAIELRVAGVVFALLAVLFVAFPEIDLAASGAFYQDGRWAFSGGNWPFFELLYRGTPRVGQALLIVLASGLLLGSIKRLTWLHARRTTFGFLLAAALLGPVLLVDATLKDGWHRARPATVAEFAGPLTFTPAFVVSDQCPKNCSFVSGHVATAAFVMAFGWLGAPAVRRRWLLASLATGTLLTVVRMTAGGHFLSDTIFAWFATYFSLWLTEWVFRRLKWLPPTEK